MTRDFSRFRSGLSLVGSGGDKGLLRERTWCLVMRLERKGKESLFPIFLRTTSRCQTYVSS